MKIPCETIARLSVLRGEGEFAAIRLDNGRVIATNRRFMAVERVPMFEGVAHIIPDDALIFQCQTEATYSSFMDVTANPALRYTIAKTTLGYTSGNIGYFEPTPDFDRWSEIIGQCADPLPASAGAMVIDMADLSNLVAASPSGVVSFETNTHPDLRPALVRDVNSPDWVGCFLPRLHDGIYHPPAALPGWVLQ